MADVTTNYSWPFQELSDPPNGATLGADGFQAADTTVKAIETALDARLDALESSPAWTAFTPVWTATSNPVIGNGSITGAYRQIGKFVTFRIRILMGSTTTYGSGAYILTYPVTAKVAYNPGITGWFLQGSNPNGVSAIGLTTTTFRMLTNSSNTYCTSAVPFTLANGSEINIGGTYEAA